MLSQERQFILGRSSDDPNFFFRKHHSLFVEMISRISIQDTFNSMCPDDDLSLSLSSILDEDLLHLALLCGLVQYSFDKGRAWWLAMTQPNRGEVQLYHGVFAKYVTDRYYGISYGMVCSGKVQQCIGVSEVQPMVTRTLLSNYPVILGDRQSPPLISSGLQSFEKDTGKPV